LVNLEGHTSCIYSIKFNGSGELICTGSNDKSIRVWEVTTGRLVRRVDCGSPVWATIWIQNTIISGCHDGWIQQWSVDQAEADLDLKGHSDRVLSLDFQPSSKLLSSGSSDKNVIVQKLDSPSSPAPLHTLTGHKSPVEEVKFSPSEAHILATWDGSGEVRLWDALAGNCLHLFQCGKGWRPFPYQWEENFINFSPDGKLLACRGSEVKLFRVATKQLAAVCKVEGKMVCWNTRGNKLAVVTKNSDDKKDEGHDIVFDI
jgi:WD40 repeat protein